MRDNVTRFGVSLPHSLVERFDETLAGLGYENRSKAIGDAVREFISQKTFREEGVVFGTISYIYDHHIPGVTSRLVEMQHDFEGSIKSTMHAHVTHEDCIEVLIVEGSGGSVKRLFGLISASRGVKNCRLSILENTTKNE